MRGLGHAAVGVGLAGWMLLAPPLRDARPNPDAPLRDWKLHGRFDSQRACEDARRLMARMTGDGKFGWEEAYWGEMADCVEEDY